MNLDKKSSWNIQEMILISKERFYINKSEKNTKVSTLRGLLEWGKLRQCVIVVNVFRCEKQIADSRTRSYKFKDKLLSDEHFLHTVTCSILHHNLRLERLFKPNSQVFQDMFVTKNWPASEDWSIVRRFLSLTLTMPVVRALLSKNWHLNLSS